MQYEEIMLLSKSRMTALKEDFKNQVRLCFEVPNATFEGHDQKISMSFQPLNGLADIRVCRKKEH